MCPFGLKSLWLLRRHGYTVDDRWLRTREETDALKARLQVDTTPQTFIGGQRIGGWDDLRRHFGAHVREKGETSYTPVVAVFGTALLIAGATALATDTSIDSLQVVERFIAIAMCLLAMLKLQDVEAFSSMFLNYDLLARRAVPYAYAYPFAELLAGVLMLAGWGLVLAVPLALFIGGVGAVSVVKAVYIDKRELRCACVGGNSAVPLGFVSLTENLMMAAMAVWMGVQAWA